jgi:hypothetical protein
LLTSGHAQVDARGFDAFVAHKVSQQGDVIVFCQEVFRETVSKRTSDENKNYDKNTGQQNQTTSSVKENKLNCISESFLVRFQKKCTFAEY